MSTIVYEFTAKLYLQGRALVLNEQRLRARKKFSRLTLGQRLDIEAHLADPAISTLVTLADHDDDKALLLRFNPVGSEYIIKVSAEGIYNGWHLNVDERTGELYVAQDTAPDYFKLLHQDNDALVNLPIGASIFYARLRSKRTGECLFLSKTLETPTFSAVDNAKGDYIHKNEIRKFVVKIVQKAADGSA